MQTISSDSLLKHTSGVLSSRVGVDTVLLDLTAGAYLGLNEVGTAVYEMLATARPLGEIHADLAKVYDVASDCLWKDIEEFARQLISHGLVEVVDAPA